MFRTLAQLILPITLMLSLAAFVGLSHVLSTVPKLEIAGQVVMQSPPLIFPKNVTIVEATYNGGASAFLSGIKGNFTKTNTYTWRTAVIDDTGAFRAVFPPQERYIGTMTPGVPSEDAAHSRELFILLESSNRIFRLFVSGDQVVVGELEIARTHSLWMASPLELHAFYSKLIWPNSSLVAVQGLARSQIRDAIRLSVQLPSNR